VVAQRGGEVDRLGPAQRPDGDDGEVARGRYDAGVVAGAQLGGVLGVGGVAGMVQAVLDPPVVAQQVGEVVERAWRRWSGPGEGGAGLAKVERAWRRRGW
jgi:hypothetical protein